MSQNRLLLWTDCPEFAIYAEYFNASQDKYRVEVRYFESPAQKLFETGEMPDVVAARWLRNASIRSHFRSLDGVFKKDGLSRSSFYPRLLSLGNIDGKQYLLPVNYNIPAMVFARDLSWSPSNPFIIEMEEVKDRSRAFNSVSRGVYTNMGFSLSTDDEFLFIVTTLFGTAFREASPIAWNSQALEQSITWIQQWIAEVNTSIQAEDDFAFKYYYEPPDKLVNSGRILFSYMDGSNFFILPEERRANLDFRWIAVSEKIPLDEGSVYFGIHKKTKNYNAARTFAQWFFAFETQKLLLEAAKSNRLNEISFGIAGGFSAMKTVTEMVFPLFYPDLLGRMPPESSLSPGNTLPRNWMTLKQRVILPYLRERIRHSNRAEIRPLERRISDWYRFTRE